MKQKKIPKTETIIGTVILVLLGVIALVLYQQQFKFNPAVNLAMALEEKSAATAGDDLGHFAPDTLKPMTPQERFTPESLSEKIDGKAELYLPAGFRQLRCRRFADREDPAAWIEVFAFDMGTTPNAFAVYSQQKRSDSEPGGLARHSYKTSNAFYFVHGRFYLELIAGAPTEKLAAAMKAFAANFIEQTEVQEQDIPGLKLFPSENLISQSVRLQPKDAFGYERFDNMFIAKYRIDGVEVTAFISERESASKAARLVDAYYEYLKMFDAVDISVAIEQAKAVELFDTIEIFFNSGKYIAGVHEASDKAAAEKLAAGLYRQLKKGDQ